MIPVQLIGAAVIAAASFAGAWQIQGMRYEKTLSDFHAQQSLALAEATKEAHDRTIQLQKQVDDAARKHARMVADLRLDAAGSRDALVSLHSAADQALRRASDSHSACIADANTLTIVFGRCTTELQSVATDADGLSAEVSLLRDAWPVQSKP